MISRSAVIALSLYCILSLPVVSAEPYQQQDDILEVIVVTATRGEGSLKDTAASVGILDEQLVNSIKPTHSSELLNRIAGVNIVQLGSSAEGAAVAIRQPVSYGPVYLYLENGVPTRSSGFFNHNALYEMNVSAANGVEVIKGPGSALYGSDAIGAVINLLSGQPPKEDMLKVGLEAGEHQWQRTQLQAATRIGEYGFTTRIEANNNNGWREHTESERQSMTSSWDSRLSEDLTVNTVFTTTNVNYETGGSALSYDDFRQDPDQAGNLIGFRKVNAFRASSAFEQNLDNASLSITPFVRSNSLEYVAHWTLNTGKVLSPTWCPTCPATLDSQDAHINESGHDSVGILFKYHRDISDNSFIITGVDVDYSKGDTKQTYIIRTDNDPGSYWLTYQDAGLLYDFDVTFIATSPYVHTETQFTDKLRLSAGLRYDNIHFDYQNNLSVVSDSIHQRLPDQSVNLDHISPKLSAIYQFSNNLNGYAAYRHAFRVPAAEQLFRSGDTENSSDLKPVKADSFELGLRGNLGPQINFDSTLYYMTKKDDILAISDELTGARRNANAGETKHYGIELGFNIIVSKTMDIYTAYTRSEHKYKKWLDSSGDFSGHDMPDAPKTFANLRFNYHPAWLKGGRLELEWLHQGSHWVDSKNHNDDDSTDRDKYNGHDLLNVRADYQATQSLNLYLRLLNAADKRYAETTTQWGPKFVPGRPSTGFIGFSYAY